MAISGSRWDHWFISLLIEELMSSPPFPPFPPPPKFYACYLSAVLAQTPLW